MEYDYWNWRTETKRTVALDDAETDDWGVLAWGVVTVTVEAKTDNFNVNDYRFQLKLNSYQTGLYSPGRLPVRLCDPDTNNSETDLVEFSSTSDSVATKDFALIRCGLGLVRNKGVNVFAEHKTPTGPRYELKLEGMIPLAKHRTEGVIKYKVNTRGVFGVRPTGVESLGSSFWDGEVWPSISEAAVIWNYNNDEGAILLKEAETNSDHNLIVQFYFRGVPDSSPCPGEDEDFKVLGCALTTFTDSHASDVTNVWMPIPPKPDTVKSNGERIQYQWTADYSKVLNSDRPNVSYVYLPAVLAHEMAHGLGLGDAYGGLVGNFHTIMGAYWDSDPAYTLAPNDKHGISEVIRPHRHR